MFVPDGFIADHFYVNNILYNENLNEWRPIISYNGTTKLIGIDLDVIYGGAVFPNWKILPVVVILIFLCLISSL